MLMLTIALAVSATSVDTLHAVTMVSYEQRWLDSEGTLALRNNTDEDIHDVTFRITYLDMKGNELDYKEFTSEVEIAPGMTRKTDIPGYEHDRNYSYYRSEASLSSPHKFKIRFEVIGYNAPKAVSGEAESGMTESATDAKADNDSYFWILTSLPFLFVIGTIVGLFALVGVLAYKRNRNVALWIVIAMFITPVLTMIILLCLGYAYDPTEDNKYDHRRRTLHGSQRYRRPTSTGYRDDFERQ